MKFSLVLATLGRKKELAKFLESLCSQTYRDFEVVIVDQNPLGFLDKVIDGFNNEINIKHLNVSFTGLSRARNYGLKYTDGDIVAFPDDDCWYGQELLDMVQQLFAENANSLDGIIGHAVTEKGDSLHAWHITRSMFIDEVTAWRSAMSITLFFRRNVIQAVRNFDEKIGVGAGTCYGAGEETDFALRGLRAGFRFKIFPSVKIYHPAKKSVGNEEENIARAYKYSCGMGYVMKKNHTPLWFVGYLFIRSIGGVFIAMLRGNIQLAKRRISGIKGRLHGLMT